MAVVACAADGGAVAAVRSDAQDAATEFLVVPGQVYELRLLLQAVEERGPAACEIGATFLDAQGRGLDPRLERGHPVLPDLAPAVIEVAPAGTLSDAAIAAAEAARFLLAPPDAHRLILSDLPAEVAVRRLSLQPVAIARMCGEQARGELADIAARRRALAARAFADRPDWVERCLPLLDAPVRQAEALAGYLMPGGDWTAAIPRAASTETLDEHDLRMTRLRAQAERPPRVGFVGSPRGREMLLGMAEVIWLRQSSWRDQIALLDLDLIVIEAVAFSGAGDDGEWLLAFSDLEGGLPDAGAALFDGAAERGLPVHLWFASGPEDVGFWREAARRADRVVATDRGLDWSALAPDHVIRRATEPASCSVASLEVRPADTMLVPVASDFFQFPAFDALINQGSLYATALAEFDYGFNTIALNNRITASDLVPVAETGRAQQRALLQSARMVLLSAQSIRSDVALARIAIDAIASGAIPVLFGRYEGTDPILSDLETVLSADDLVRLQAQWRIGWVRERRWRDLFRHVMRDHVWRTEDRAALLGRDPFPEGFDRPRITAIMPTMRPHLARRCLETFRAQNWPDKELILVFNTGAIPDDLPALRDNEHAYALPPSKTIGECLNRGIARATGRYWAKMDDDDFYASTYLEETVHYYRASQADVVGRQAAAYYFDGEKLTRWRAHGMLHCHRMLVGRGHISGASLSGDRCSNNPSFSVVVRNSMDALWVRRLVYTGQRIFSGDGTSMVVFRDGDRNRHTWKLNGSFENTFVVITDDCLFDRLES